MKKTFNNLIALAFLAVFLLAGQVYAVDYDYWAQVYKLTNDTQGDAVLTEVNSGITFQVLGAGSDTAATCYVMGTSTSLTNPVTTTNFASTTYCGGKVKFRTTSSSQDLIVTHTTGMYSAVIKSFTPQMHKIVIDERTGMEHVGIIWFTSNDNSETDTGIDFVADTLISDVRVEVVTVDAGETLDVGLLSTETSGDADGLRDGVSVATAGFVADTGVITNGTTVDYTPDSTYGALLYTIIAGSDVVATCGGRSYLGHVVTGSNATSLTYTESAGGDTAAGYIYVWHTRLR